MEGGIEHIFQGRNYQAFSDFRKSDFLVYTIIHCPHNYITNFHDFFNIMRQYTEILELVYRNFLSALSRVFYFTFCPKRQFPESWIQILTQAM